MNLRDLAKGARTLNRAVKGGRKQVQQLRDAADIGMAVLDTVQALTGHVARNPSVGTLAGLGASMLSRMVPDAPETAAPIETPRAAPRRPVAVDAVVTPPRKQRPLRVVADVIDAEIVAPEGVIDPSKPYHRKAQ